MRTSTWDLRAADGNANNAVAVTAGAPGGCGAELWAHRKARASSKAPRLGRPRFRLPARGGPQACFEDPDAALRAAVFVWSA
ncbi:hypothetical protein AK812_SmicGene367 [Symbiodinium microadriaticum]|uniref:Uncharacterized protein n=1 Tax=Symbiodinium microadriaticum TaxID=2951 RepID=A0A1Q9F6V7_SYMMI|nr:hypothetical protein AK812_SmicGene367 [Symbiodinium microadriaticum]